VVKGEKFYNFDLIEKGQNQCMVSLTLPYQNINLIYKNAVLMHRSQASTYGFSQGSTPVSYIETTYRPNILEHIKDLLFIHCVMNLLCQSLYTNKIVVAGDPKLLDIVLDQEKGAQFLFSISKMHDIVDEKWKKINIKIAPRKNYKDIDKQVFHFLKEEADGKANYKDNGISYGDWVFFTMELVDEAGNPTFSGYEDQLWVKISEEETDQDLHALFIGKKVGDIFITNSHYFQEYINNDFGLNYQFKIKITDFINNAYFCVNLFKKHFQLKVDKEIHQKLIEVFSFRNDISQRRETVENTLKSLVRQYYVTLPPHLLERQKQLVLADVHVNPDYYVYKSQSDFKDKIKMLAEKQLRETIIIDGISYQENIAITDQDVYSYLNLMQRARTRGLLYFKIPTTKFNSQEVPLPHEIIKQYCLREKTLNYVISYLTKKKVPK